MGLIYKFFDFFIHLDIHLKTIIQSYGDWTYLILFAIIFCETGLVVTPLLPGDSLLFAAGSFAALGALKVQFLFFLLWFAAVAGDNLNYWIGYHIGPKIFHKENVRFLNKEYLKRGHKFYEKYGGKTIIIARFMPIIRTFSPFVAGIAKMSYLKFLAYDIFGGGLWIGIFVFGGYYFGNLPTVKHNFTLVILAIIIISVMPGVIEYFRHRGKKKD
ncbi:MAG: DedA family protein [bacterium]